MIQNLDIPKCDIYFSERLFERVVLDSSSEVFRPKFMVNPHVSNQFNLDYEISSGYPFVYIRRDNEDIEHVIISAGVIRAYPIFYSMVNGILCISDNPDYILSKKQLAYLSPLSVEEFLCTGYVTSRRTLIKDLYSLEAGEVLTYTDGLFQVLNDYCYSNTVEERDSCFYETEFKNASQKVFSELIKALEGKTAIVPLSGGYDSRFIAAMLKLNGFEDVICLSYGVPGNDETKISRIVAQKLNYEWHYVPYDFESLVSMMKSSEFGEYLEFSHNYVSTPVFQEFLSTQYIYNQFRTDERDFVFIPGHTADVLAGSHLSPVLLNSKSSIDDVVRYISNWHYQFREGYENSNLHTELSRQLQAYQKIDPLPCSMYEMWEWRERQAKFIVNANRIYEFFGYRWHLPFWEKQYMDFWRKVPPQMKLNKNLYDRILEDTVFHELNIDFDKEARVNQKNDLLVRFSKNVFVNTSLLPVFRKVKPIFKKYLVNEKNPCGFEASNCTLEELAKDQFPGGYSQVNQMIVKSSLGKRGPDVNSYISEYVLSMILECENWEIGL